MSNQLLMWGQKVRQGANLTPQLSGLAVYDISDTICKTNGAIDPKLKETIVTFEWGIEGITFPNSVAIGTFSVAATWEAFPVSGLPQGTLIYWRYKAVSATKTIYSDVATFTTTDVLIEAILTSKGLAVSTFRLTTTENTTLTLDGTGVFTDSAGVGTDTSLLLTTGGLKTLYVKVSSGISKLTFPKRSVITEWGSDFVNVGWATGATSPAISVDISRFSNLARLWISGHATLIGNIAESVVYLNLGSNITYNTANKFPNSCNQIVINGNSINYSSLDFSGTANIITLALTNWRNTKLTSAEMVTILTSLKNRVGNVQASTITINDYADYASPPQTVIDAVAALKLVRTFITTVNLGA